MELTRGYAHGLAGLQLRLLWLPDKSTGRIQLLQLESATRTPHQRASQVAHLMLVGRSDNKTRAELSHLFSKTNVVTLA